VQPLRPTVSLLHLPTGMNEVGLLLDSSVLIAQERRGLDARTAITVIAKSNPSDDVSVSVVSLMELAHGIARANSEQIMKRRTTFIRELLSSIPILGIDNQLALKIGIMDGQLAQTGIRIPIEDLIIGVTAMENGFDVLTKNVRHFRMIPGLVVHEYVS